MARIPLALVLLLALAHGLAYAVIVPIWQAPDEPMLYEYAALTAELGRLPQVEDRSPALEQRLAASLSRQDFWRYTIRRMPEALPQTMAEVQVLYPMPRQVGGDPPLYFLIAALPLRLTAGWPPERQVLLLRLLNVLLLPAVVACAYGAACEVFLDRRPPTTDHRFRGSRPLTPIPLAVAALVACHPMFAAISASLSNDGLANLLGAALCWAILRLLRVGASARGVALLVGLLALGLLTKRTLLPYVPLLVLLGVGRGLEAERRGLGAERRGLRIEQRSVLGVRAWPQVARPSALVLVMSLVAVLWISQQFDFQAAAMWTRFGVWTAPARVWPEQPAGDPALRLGAGELDLQPFPAVGGDRLRGRAVRYGARVWSDVPARGRLIVFDGAERHEWPFEIQGALAPEVALLIPAVGRSPWFGVAADSGWFYADDFSVIGEGSSNNLLMNSGLDLPSLRPGSPLWPLARYLRLPDIVWTLASGYIAGSAPLGRDWLNLLFASFWGHFGWMDVPFVLGSWWQPLLALICLAGLLGALRRLLWRQDPRWRRRQVWMLLVLVSIALALPVINAFSMPRGQALQQGRYLFPELVAVALLLALGQSALLPASRRRGWLWLWLCFWPALGLAALLRVFLFYA
ncbi:MAG TPA: hypothetical protein VFO07_10950 [Roseiflexaceae bacterium]|nr:hypothetical protein [Roseiflexaceae bacterium]